MAEAQNVDVFISYRRSDSQHALQLQQSLARRGISAWYDVGIEVGDDWRASIISRIEGAKVFAIVFSAAVNDSEEILKELVVAKSVKARIVVIRVDSSEPRGPYRYELSWINWLSAYPDVEGGIERFSGAIARILAENCSQMSVERSMHAIGARRLWRHLAYTLANSNHLLASIALIASIATFTVHEILVGVIASASQAGADPLPFVAVVAFLSSVGAPLLVVEAFAKPITLGKASVGLLALITSIAEFLIARNLAYSWLAR